jgi:hypothetical protein
MNPGMPFGQKNYMFHFDLQSAGMQAVDEIVPALLHALEDDETSTTALDGLKQILR